MLRDKIWEWPRDDATVYLHGYYVCIDCLLAPILTRMLNAFGSHTVIFISDNATVDRV